MFRTIGGIILAAGASSRFPGNKLLYRIDNTPIISRVLNVLKPYCTEIAIIIQAEDKMLPSLLKEEKVTLLVNSNWNYGMTTSVKIGVKYFYNKVDAVAILPADHPYLTPNDLSDFFLRVKADAPLIAIPTYQNRGGHPLIVSIKLQDELLGISEETEGLKEIIQRFKMNIMRISVNSSGILHDIDKIEDLR